MQEKKNHRLDNGRRPTPDQQAQQDRAWPLVPSGLIAVAGGWLLLAPTLLRYSDSGIDAASWNDRTVGPTVAIVAVLRLVSPGVTTVLSLINAALGCWLVAAPFALGYDHAPRALRNDIVLGVVILTLALLSARGRASEERLRP